MATNTKRHEVYTALRRHIDNPSAPLPEGFEWIGGKTPQSVDTPTGLHCAKGSTTGTKSVCQLCGK